LKTKVEKDSAIQKKYASKSNYIFIIPNVLFNDPNKAFANVNVL
jgi:hypothetical protein